MSMMIFDLALLEHNRDMTDLILVSILLNHVVVYLDIAARKREKNSRYHLACPCVME